MSGKESKTATVSGKNRTKPTVDSTPASKRLFAEVSPACPENQVTLLNIKILLKEALEPLTLEIDELRKSVEFTSSKLDEMSHLHAKVENLEKKCEHMSRQLSASEARCELLHEKLLTQEIFSRKNNLKFVGIKCAETAQENCETIILNVCSQIGLKIHPRDIKRAHRVGPSGNPSRPIIVKLLHFKDRQLILMEKQKFRAVGVRVMEDFPPKIQLRRRMCAPVVQAAYKSGKDKASLIGDKLLLNGKLYGYKDVEKLPNELQPGNLSTVTSGEKIAFFTCSSKLSNHNMCKFAIEGRQFTSVEQYLMFCKVNEFGDNSSAKAILSTDNPV